jgi:hypothetical protein
MELNRLLRPSYCRHASGLVAGCLLLLRGAYAGPSRAQRPAVSPDPLQLQFDDNQWVMPKNYASSRYSGLDQINSENVYELSLFRSAARSLSLVSQDGTDGEELSLPGSWALPIPPRPGSNSVLTRPSRSAVQPGESPCTMVASFAGSDSTTSASPRLHAAMIWRAARSALWEMRGNASVMLNHMYSSRCRPLKNALRGLPVRISPGHTVVTVIRSFANSARNPSDNPTRANLLALYGKRCGMLTLPPMEAMLTIRPSRRRRMAGSTARIV